MNTPATIILAILSLSRFATAATVEKQGTYFVQANSVTQVGIARPFPSDVEDTASKTYSGTCDATLGIDCGTLELKTFNFNGGAITTTAYELDFGTLITYPIYGSKYTYVNRQSTAINYSPETTSTFGPGLVLPDGSLFLEQHRLLASNGITATVRSVAGTQQPRIITDYLNFPDHVPFFGGTKVTVEEVSNTLYQRRIRTTVTIDVAVDNLLLLPGLVPSLGANIVETEDGTVTIRSNQLTIPSCFGLWSSTNKLTNPTPETLNSFGIPYAILMALNLPVTASVLPITIEHTEYGPIATIDLPADGLENPMSVEYTTDLADPEWDPLPTSHYLHGADSLDYGKNGSPTFSFPSGNGGFIRFVSIVE